MEATAQPLPPLDIVVLDDDADFRQYLEDVLKDDGHQVRLCATPDEMWAMNAERLPDVVLLDMKMGEFRGDNTDCFGVMGTVAGHLFVVHAGELRVELAGGVC